MIIGISGHKQSGKNTVGNIIQYLMHTKGIYDKKYYKEFCDNSIFNRENFSGWKLKAFADKLKDIVCLLIGCTREQLEDITFKEAPLGEEWSKYVTITDIINWLKQFKLEEYLKEQDRREGGVIFENELLEFANKLGYNNGELTPRLLLQLLGTDCGRNIIHPNIWINATMSEYKKVWKDPDPIPNNDYTIKTLEIISDDVCRITYGEGSEAEVYKHEIVSPNWIITDVRFPNEVKTIKDKGGIIIRIDRPRLIGQINVHPDGSQITHLIDQHESETALDDYTEFDYTINNDKRIEELINKVKLVLEKANLLK